MATLLPPRQRYRAAAPLGFSSPGFYDGAMSKVYAVEYHYVTDRDEEMAEVRPSHRAFNGELAEQGKLIAAGPYVGTHDALILVRAESPEAALQLLDADPFHQAGFIAERLPREWNPVIGVLS